MPPHDVLIQIYTELLLRSSSMLGIGGHNGKYGDTVLAFLSLTSSKKNGYESNVHVGKYIDTNYLKHFKLHLQT